MEMTDEDNGSTQEVVAVAPVIDQHHPLFMQSSDTPGSSLITVKLTGPENYTLWSSTMRVSLLEKSKLGFVDGRYPKEKFPPVLHELWEKCNAIVLSWIMNFMSAKLLSGMVYASSAHKVWMDLKETFDKVNGSRVLYLHKQIVTLTQGLSFVYAYFSKLKELWAEFDALIPCPGCGCEESKKYVEHFEYQRLLQFLMGLNETYSQSSNHILNMSPRPSINKAYSMIISKKSRRAMSHSSQLNAKGNLGKNHNFLGNEVTALFSSKRNACAGYGHSGGGNHSASSYRPRKNNLHCDYCNFKGHTRETCYKLNEYPPDFKSKKKGEFGNTVNYAQTNVGNYMTDTPTGPAQAGSTANFAGVSHVQQVSQNFQAGIPQFTQEQYNHILQLLDKQPECSGSAMAVGMLLCGDITKILAKLIVDSGASSHLENDFSLLINAKTVGDKGGKVHLPTGSVAHVSHIGSSSILKDLIVSNVMHIPDFKSSSVDRLGHAALDTLKKLNGFHDFQFVECSSKDKHCTVCPLAKQTRLPFPLSPTLSKSYFYTIHDNIWGHYRVPTYDGKRYFLTLVDDCSRSDNGCELFNSHMSELLQSLGIIHQSSCIYTPQQNGVVERRHKYILEHMRVFECLGYVVTVRRPDKFAPKAYPAVFLGCSAMQKGYRMFGLHTKEFHISRDVVFKEDVFPFQHMSYTSSTLFPVLDLNIVSSISPTNASWSIPTQSTPSSSLVSPASSNSAGPSILLSPASGLTDHVTVNDDPIIAPSAES
ncbi:uncharacterized protein LOC142179975 [Nicotiana tabacum]|uniref:Uncharacterized protein LOC142179975 n=1 Tax=Nicotiana tabacum TaxID=4097 RepID=A0AC58UBW8_TOBAC